MKRIKMFFYAMVLSLSFSGMVFAGVTFLPGGGTGVGYNGQVNSGAARCQQAGYVKTSCVGQQVLTDRCPYDSSYYKSCECPQGYVLTRSECTANCMGRCSSCNGKYKCDD